MNLSCPNCNQKANVKSLNLLKDAIIKCSACETQYHVEGDIVNPSDRSYKQITQAPKGIQVENHINSKTITIGATLRHSLMSVLFGVLFLGVLGYQCYMAPQLFTFGWPLIPIGIFAGIGLYRIVAAFRKKVIHISPKELKITHSMPGIFLKDKIFSLLDFTQFYTKKIVTENNDNKVVSYALQGILKNGAGEINIIDGFLEADQVYFLEREIETILDIQDVKVEEEYDDRTAIKMTVGKAFKLAKAVIKNNKKD